MGSSLSFAARTPLIAIVLALSAIGTSPTKADVLVVGGGWDTFSFNGVGSPLLGFPSGSPDFTFTLTSPATFKVTDAFVDSDQFAISINGATAVDTSVPANDGTNFGANYDAAFASPLFSHAAFDLAPGTYDITGSAVLAPFEGGSGAVELVANSAAPEASTWTMMILGFLGLGFMAYRRKLKPALIAT